MLTGGDHPEAEFESVYAEHGIGGLHDTAELENLFGRPEVAKIERELLADLLAWTLRMQDLLPLPGRRYIMKTDPRNWWAAYR